MFEIILHRRAAKFFKDADAATKKRISDAFDILSMDPRCHAHMKKLKGELKSMFRFRTGNLRILYEIEDNMQTVRVKVIEARGSVYKNLRD
jgi:mRNA-degrading endonuclease RelE of RelBE toxin-antitoxin system